MKNVVEIGVIGKKWEVRIKTEPDSFEERYAMFELNVFPYDETQTKVWFALDHVTAKNAAKYYGQEVITAPLLTIKDFEDLPRPKGDTCTVLISTNIFDEHKKRNEDLLSFLLWCYDKVFLIFLEPVADSPKDSGPTLTESDLARATANKIQYVHENDLEKYDNYSNAPWVVKKIKD